MNALKCMLFIVALSLPGTVKGADIRSVTDLASVTILGASEQDVIGFYHDGCGDVDRDGIDDFVMGTGRLVGYYQTNHGYILGGSEILSATMDLVSPPAGTTMISHDRLGLITVAGGDFNGDSYGDVVFADPGGSPNGIGLAGRAVLVYGNPDLPDEIRFDTLDTPGVSIPGYRRNGSLGYVMSRAGDINGDGFTDLLIGSPGRYTATDEQEAFLIWGGTDVPASLDLGDLGSRGVRFAGRNFGWDVAEAGDVNGDGFDDLLIGSYGGLDGELGHAYVIYGATDLPGEILQADIADYGVDIVAAEIDDGFGGFVSGAGDINGDGYDDMLMSAWNANPNGIPEAGIAYAVFGGPALPSTLNIAELGDAGITIYETKLMGWFGRTLAGVGDINFDGIDDCLISSDDQNYADDNAFILLGSRNLPRGGPYVKNDFQHVKLTHPDPNSGFCSGAAIIGDVNGDGLEDLMLGNAFADPEGRFAAGEAYIIYGGTLFPPPPDVDLNDDGVIDALDLFLFQKQWKKSSE